VETKLELPAACSAILAEHLKPDLFRALADPTRLTVLARLAVAERPLGVTDVSGCCGVHLSGVSRHLSILRRAGIVHSERRGREVLYRLDCAALSGLLRGLADAVDACVATCCRPQEESHHDE
jgi:DNA-binding transcriptional ArsR family regulator